MNKEEHLAEIRVADLRRQLMRAKEDLATEMEHTSKALAERDAAREELANLKAAQPVAEPAAPAQEGPFRREGCYFVRGWSDDWLRIADGSSAHRADEALRLLNLGVEAEKLRARVAELEGELDQAREHREAYGRDREALKARADAAEAQIRDREDSITELQRKLAAHDKALDNAWTELESVHPVGIIGCADIDAAVKVICDELKRQDAQVKNLKAKLAGLGENPIPREVVRRWRMKYHVGHPAGEVLDHILSGREPGGAS